MTPHNNAPHCYGIQLQPRKVLFVQRGWHFHGQNDLLSPKVFDLCQLIHARMKFNWWEISLTLILLRFHIEFHNWIKFKEKYIFTLPWTFSSSYAFFFLSPCLLSLALFLSSSLLLFFSLFLSFLLSFLNDTEFQVKERVWGKAILSHKIHLF